MVNGTVSIITGCIDHQVHLLWTTSLSFITNHLPPKHSFERASSSYDIYMSFFFVKFGIAIQCVHATVQLPLHHLATQIQQERVVEAFEFLRVCLVGGHAMPEGWLCGANSGWHSSHATFCEEFD
jgi:hypothetical protein